MSEKGNNSFNAANFAPSDLSANVAIIIVTYKRNDLLKNLLESIVRTSHRPRHVIVVDNANDRQCSALVSELGATDTNLGYVYLPQTQNLGGTGGFATGMQAAQTLGATHFWLMDDDVEVLPDGLTNLLAWTEKFPCVLGRRLDADDQPFFWQQYLNTWLGVPLSKPGNVFNEQGYWLTNCGCFEGMMIHRDVAEALGPPDPRFFMTGDDTIYGWLASLQFEVAYVDTFALKKVRPQRQISVGFRHLNDSSDLSRFHTMKNRALFRHYLKQHGAFRPVGFAIGTALTLGKELLRAIAVEHSLAGVPSLIKGMREARRLSAELDTSG